VELSIKNLRVITEHTRPDQLPVADAALLADQVGQCAPYITSWAEQEEFWEIVSVKEFAQQMAAAVADQVGGDEALANWIVSGIPALPNHAKSAQKAVQVIADHVQGFLGVDDLIGKNQDKTIPLKMLGQLFQAASGGLLIAAAALAAEPTLSVQASAYSAGLTAIATASKTMRTELAGKLPGFNC